MTAVSSVEVFSRNISWAKIAKKSAIFMNVFFLFMMFLQEVPNKNLQNSFRQKSSNDYIKINLI